MCDTNQMAIDDLPLFLAVKAADALATALGVGNDSSGETPKRGEAAVGLDNVISMFNFRAVMEFPSEPQGFTDHADELPTRKAI